MAQQQYGDSMAQDASNVANAAVQTAKDVKTAAAVAGNIAVGNVAGAVKETLKNPEFLKKNTMHCIGNQLFLIYAYRGAFYRSNRYARKYFFRCKRCF